MFVMQVNLDQYIESAEIILLQKKQSITVPSLCRLLETSPNTCKLYLTVIIHY